jgi:hypothetical protein
MTRRRGLSTKASAAKRASQRVTAAADPGNDDAVVSALKLSADNLRRHNDDRSQIAARIVDWAATAEGMALRDLVSEFAARQANAPSLAVMLVDVPFRTLRQHQADMEKAIERWQCEVLDDGCGNPWKVDVAEYIGDMAYWIASAEDPKRWLWKSIGSALQAKHLAAVKTKALELADLLEDENGPIWPSAIELFEQNHRPIWDGEGTPLEKYRVLVANRLKGQQLQGVLRNLAMETERQARIAAREREEVPRPKTVRHVHMMTDRAKWWFEYKCRLKTMPVAVIDRLIKATQPPKSHYMMDVKERLRQRRNRKRKP